MKNIPKLITKLKNKISEFAKDEKTSTNKNKINEQNYPKKPTKQVSPIKKNEKN